MSEHDFLQSVIAFTWILATVLLGTRRYVIGCFVVLAGLPAWWIAAGDSWGFKVVAVTMAIVYTIGLIGRWPKRPTQDEYEQLGV